MISVPSDFGLAHTVAIALLFICWFGYSFALATIGRGSLNSQLAVVQGYWMAASTRRPTKPFDAVLLGHIINAISFFGSATMIVIAGVLTLFINVRSMHATMSELHFIQQISLELFSLQIALLALVLALCFFSFTYALRKLIYTIALLGALPDISEGCETHDDLVAATTRVLSEAIKTLNFGIRGYYYAIAALFIFASPYACMAATLVVTFVLFYRQLATPTAKSIQDYVVAAKALNRTPEK
ncbi:MAG: DUF599 domain-containing protein [Hyphomicrobiaceae bacterium]